MPKTICRHFTVLFCLLLAGCAKTSVHMSCMPSLHYELSPKSEVLDFGESAVDSVRKALAQKKLNTSQGSVRPLGGHIGPASIKVKDNFRRLNLLGPVYIYQKSPVDPFAVSGTSVYVDIDGKKLWIDLLELNFITLALPSENNINTSKKLGIPSSSSVEFDYKNWQCPLQS
ncbi:hypothetical protein [Thalassomonas actiniarum]|uniref:Uncharacterized protein n=1 Tax=Thalassomonas actiniarum TaxID=485447 RepID=A0AAE9YN72_9GAMM|nr:hypothetical protein [Thalassomonas actiniarum]WDD98165.1 hypothetical protein SG35_023255 [Thalassomonas actiniarum]